MWLSRVRIIARGTRHPAPRVRSRPSRGPAHPSGRSVPCRELGPEVAVMQDADRACRPLGLGRSRVAHATLTALRVAAALHVPEVKTLPSGELQSVHEPDSN